MRRWIVAFLSILCLSIFSIYYNTGNLLVDFNAISMVDPELTTRRWHFPGKERNSNRNFDSSSSIVPSPTSELNDPAEHLVGTSTKDSEYDDSLYIYKGYIDRRSGSTKIVIFSLNECLPDNFTINGVVHGTNVRFRAEPISRECPWNWASKCRYNAYILESITDLQSLRLQNGTELILHHSNDRSMTIKLSEVKNEDDGALTICIPPLYWFTDWPTLLVFLEVWRTQGASHFVFYFNSASEQVLRILKHYQAEKLVTIVPWPRFPTSSQYDPNQSTYRLAHLITHLDCVLRTKTQFGASVDVDEFLIVRNATLLEYISKKLTNTHYGALKFNHSFITLQPPLYDRQGTTSSENINYEGIQNVLVNNSQGPSKIAYSVKDVNRITTHAVTDLFGGKKVFKINTKNAALYHNRYTNYGPGRNTTKLRSIQLLPYGTNLAEFQQRLANKTKIIFPNGTTFNTEAQVATGVCLKPWRSSCKTPIETCSKHLLSLEKWSFMPYSEEYGFRRL